MKRGTLYIGKRWADLTVKVAKPTDEPLPSLKKGRLGSIAAAITAAAKPEEDKK